MKCPSCQSVLDERFKYCPSCGSKVELDHAEVGSDHSFPENAVNSSSETIHNIFQNFSDRVHKMAGFDEK